MFSYFFSENLLLFRFPEDLRGEVSSGHVVGDLSPAQGRVADWAGALEVVQHEALLSLLSDQRTFNIQLVLMINDISF